MSFFTILETLLIGPLKLVFEVIYVAATRMVNHPGIAIIFLSVIMNILVLPLYRRADATQEAVRNKEAQIHDGVAHIKKTFSGDEQLMILQTYYRQNHYKPLDVISGSISLLLEIPFFMAAYQFLSHLELLHGAAMGPIKDLSEPDELLSVAGISFNLLPILMTLINVISSALYLKGFPLKTKIQLYGMALIFLIVLYPSPSGLVFYWTLNNLFSLGKNICYKLKNPQKMIRLLCAGVGLSLLIFGAVANSNVYAVNSISKRALIIIIGFLFLQSLLFPVLKKTLNSPNSKSKSYKIETDSSEGTSALPKGTEKRIRILCAAVSLILLLLTAFFLIIDYQLDLSQQIGLVSGAALMLLLALFIPMINKAVPADLNQIQLQPNPKLFYFGTIFLTVLIGLLIPTTLISDSPQDFIDITFFHNPLWYVVSAVCMATGTFLIWFRVFYRLAPSKVKCLFEIIIWISCGQAFVNYMFFGTKLGIITSELRYENGMDFPNHILLINLLIFILIVAVFLLCNQPKKWQRAISNGLIVSVIAMGIMSVWNTFKIEKTTKEVSDMTVSQDGLPELRLSKTGKNVIVFMLDRSMGGYIPFIFNEKPELQKQFDGFTFYDNTISFGPYTNFTTSSMLGGYEYSPIEMNKRSDESLTSKHNEALKVMPVLFSQNGYQVTVCDPPYANYMTVPDLSIYDDCPGVSAYITKGKAIDDTQKQANILQTHRNLFCFGLMKTLPLLLQEVVYDKGNYFDIKSLVETINMAFLDNYNVLLNLPQMTTAIEDETNTFLFIDNELTHRPIILQEPDYIPSINVDNTKYDAEHTDRFIVNGRKLRMEDDIQISQYHVDIAAMLQLGKWFDYLRENGVYDNTRIILVSDHGKGWGQLDDLIIGEPGSLNGDMEFYYPLLMVKDFNSNGFMTSSEFMTNADVPTLAMKDLIDDPINPFTGKRINNDEKYAHDQFIILSPHWDTDINNGNSFLPSQWAKVINSIWDKDNWTVYDEETVLYDYAAP